VKLAQGDGAGAADILAQAAQAASQSNLVYQTPVVVAAQVVTFLRQGDLAAAAHLAQTHNLPISQARVLLAQGDASAALAILEPFRQQMEGKSWQDERLKVMALQAVALHAQGEKDKAMQVLGDALALAEPGGFIRLFIDEGEPMRRLIADCRLQIANTSQNLRLYLDKLLAAFDSSTNENRTSKIQNWVEPLSERELQVLRLIDQGLSNREIGVRLVLALDTVKGHNRRIYDKLQVQSRTEALARARELGLL
jgi:LuxR family maltose regulon positive regulatory protein